MAIMEIGMERLQQEKNTRLRFFMDSIEKIHIHLWQRLEDDSFLKFQLSDDAHILEWNLGSGFRTGCVDDGSRGMMMKASPIMVLSVEKNQEVIRFFLEKMERQHPAPKVQAVIEEIMDKMEKELPQIQ